MRRHFGGDEVKTLHAIQAASIYLIVHKPASYLNECAKSLATFWMPMDTPLANGGSEVLKALWLTLALGISLLFAGQLFVAAGLIIFQFSYRQSARMPTFVAANQGLVAAYSIGIGIIFYNMVVSCCLGIGTARYRTPTDLIIIATGIMGYTLWSEARTFFGARSLRASGIGVGSAEN